MKKFTWIVMWCGLIVPHTAQGADQAELMRVAESVAPQIEQAVLNKLGGAQIFRLAVFMPGNSKGQVTAAMAEPAQVLQGELIYHLQKEFAQNNQTKVLVLTKAGLERQFRDATRAVDPTALDASNPQATADALKALDLQAAVLGSFDAESYDQISQSKLTTIRISLMVIFQDATFVNIPTSAQTTTQDTQQSGTQKVTQQDYTIPDISTNTTGRFAVEVYSAVNNYQSPLPYVTSKDPESQYHNVFFLVVPKEVRRAIEDTDPSNDHLAEYKIRISNRGTPYCPIDTTRSGVIENSQDSKRQFTVAVLVDGVNTFYERDPYGYRVPMVRHPDACSKWVLTGPGWGYRRDAFSKYSLTQVSQNDHSAIDIPGFQTGTEQAHAFTFTRASDSIAETVGITNDIGLISVHFYPEKMTNDIVSFASPETSAGTRAGRTVDHPVVEVTVDTYKNPCEVWRIFYRFEGDLPIDNPVPVVFNN